MTTHEIYPSPTVKQVIFQIRFPSLFYLESKIGDYQLKVMERFPQSSILYRQRMVFADFGPDIKVDQAEPQKANKIWRFISEKDFIVNVLTDSLDITSSIHKTYDHKDSPDKFRDVIEYVISRFLEVTGIPILSRIGLRYIDECPIPVDLNNETFQNYYHTSFPLSRFSINDSQEMQFISQIKRGDYFLRFAETFSRQNSKPNLILDFDGFALNAKASQYLNIADSLHSIIDIEWRNSLRDPVFAIMRNHKESKQ